MHKLLSFLVLISLASVIVACSSVEEFEGTPIRQYATKVIGFSTEWNTSPGTWSASRVLGKENVFPNYGDVVDAWASKTADGQREFLVLGFDTLQTVHTIEIYETYNPGAIDSLFVREAATKQWHRIYSKPAVKDLPQESRIFSIYFRETVFKIDAIRIAIDSPEIPGWNEIDAIAITGQRDNK